MKNRLTDKQRAFINHYLAFGTDTFFNATQSAGAAGYKGNYWTLHSMGWENLQKPAIRQHIEARLAEAGANADELIHRWLTVTRIDLSPYVTSDGLALEELKKAGLGFLIKGVRHGAGGKVIYELRDPEKAEEQLAKHLGMFVERREHSGSVEVITKTVGGGVVEEL